LVEKVSSLNLLETFQMLRAATLLRVPQIVASFVRSRLVAQPQLSFTTIEAEWESMSDRERRPFLRMPLEGMNRFGPAAQLDDDVHVDGEIDSTMDDADGPTADFAASELVDVPAREKV
jgi:hypothetical protein